MKKIKSLVALSLALCMVLCFAGCSSNNDEGSLKDNLVNGFNNWLESFSKHAVTKDKNLQGERENDTRIACWFPRIPICAVNFLFFVFT